MIHREHIACGLCGEPYWRPPSTRGRFCSTYCYHMASRQAASKDLVEKWSIPEPNSGCWLWLGCLTHQGYGTIMTGRTAWFAHRLAYKMFNGELRDDLVVRHTCDNPPCVNPEHLLIGTNKDNTQDAVSRGRMDRGSNRWSALLCEEDVPDIRQRLDAGETCISIAVLYSVDRSTISMIKRGKTWRHV